MDHKSSLQQSLSEMPLLCYTRFNMIFNILLIPGDVKPGIQVASLTGYSGEYPCYFANWFIHILAGVPSAARVIEVTKLCNLISSRHSMCL